MATINPTDVMNSITGYIENNQRPCPAHFLTSKFGDDVAETITNLKKDGKIIGRRGRNGGIVLPDTVFDKKNIVAKPVQVEQDSSDDTNSDSDDMDIVDLA